MSDQQEKSAAAAADRRQNALHGKVLPQLLKMAAPNAVAFLVQAVVSMTEVWYVGQLGTISLAAMAFVFPGLMLMQMLSGGAMGGAVASSIARALGAAQLEKAKQLVWHGLAIAVAAGLIFCLTFLLLGRPMLELLGAKGEVLEQAMAYGYIIFPGCVAIWLTSILSGVFRGMGNMSFPALLMGVSGITQVILSGTLVLGWFGAPQLGIVGAAISVIVVAAASTIAAVLKLSSHTNAVRLEKNSASLKSHLFADIFKVGALASLAPILSVSTIMVVNGIISDFGDAVIAGYGIGSRLEFLLIPMIFGFGAAMNTLVGMNVGAGNVNRAEHIAFVGGSAAALITGVVGLTLAIFPDIWIGLFTDDPATAAAGARYLQISGWAFAFQGVGLSLYFASQGAGKVGWPVASNFVRFAVGAGGAWLAVVVFNTGVEWVYISLALGMFFYGAITAASIWLGAWRTSG